MEENLIPLHQLDKEKAWNWNMDTTCANSCVNLLVAHMHVINAVTLVVFVMLCYFVTLLINFVKYKNFTTTIENLLITSIIVYMTWNIFFGFPVKHLEKNTDGITLSYTSCALSHFFSIMIATLFLFLNHCF